MNKIGETGWSLFSHLFFHPDGRLCGVQGGKDFEAFEIAPPPPCHDWDWVNGATHPDSNSPFLVKNLAAKGTTLAIDDVKGALKFNAFEFLFFDPSGMFYGVTGGKLYKGVLKGPSTAKQWLHTAKLLGVSGWDSFDFLFLDPEGILHGVKNGKLHRRSPPTDTHDNWLESSTLIGTSGRSDFKFLFFMSNGELYGVHQDNFYKGSPPTQAVSSDKWLNSSTLIGKGGWNEFKFLMSPVKMI